MPLFSYVARNSGGRPQQGTQEAASAAALVTALRERGWLVLEVKEAGATAAGASWTTYLNPLRWLPPRSSDIEISLQQMAVMLRSGLTLLTTLKTIAEYASSWSMRRTWEGVAEKIQQGAALAEAMAEYRCFPRLVLQMVKVGEQTGTLESVVTRAAEALERRRFLRTHILTALFYPTVVLIAALGVAGFMVVVLIPKMKVFLTALGRKLPAMTQNLVDVGDFFQTYGLYIVIGIVAAIAALIATYLWPPGRLFIDRYVLRIPVLGKLLRLSLTIQFSYGLAVLLRSGITLVEGLRTVEQLHNNRWAAGRVGEARAAVLRGGGLAPPLTFPGVYLPMLARMVAVGESAGTLDDILMEVARFHEAQLQSTIKLFSTIIEPVIIVVVGSIVGYVYIAFFLALFAAAGSAR